MKVARDTSKTQLGFWIYLMTDCILFATLFATFAVLRANTHDGPIASEIVDLPYVLLETVILLMSSFAVGMAVLAAKLSDTPKTLFWLGITGVLGLAFLGLEISEFRVLFLEGADWQRSAFLSAYFTLVGTHGLHIAAGLLWLATLVFVLLRRGLQQPLVGKLVLFGVFWHFLDLVWIFIFSIVYLMGAL